MSAEQLDGLIERVKAALAEPNFSDVPTGIRVAVSKAIIAQEGHSTYSPKRAMLAAGIAFLTALKDNPK